MALPAFTTMSTTRLKADGNMSCLKSPKGNKTVKYPPKSLKLALKEIREEKRGIRETCNKYGIPRSTIQDRLSGKRGDEIQTRGPEPILGIAGEYEVVQWLTKIAECGFSIKKQELLDTVQKILKDLKKPNPFKGDRPGQTWYLSFIKRNPEIGRRLAESINKARERVTEESIQLWLRELEIYLAKEGHSEILQHPDRVFIAEERRFSLCPKTGLVLGPIGYRNVNQVKTGCEKDNLTVLISFNACGQVCPPLVVFPYLHPPKAISDSMPPDWCLGRSESGWMKCDVFFEYMINDFNTCIEQNGIQKPVLFLIDSQKSHMSMMLSSMCEERGIILYALPPNTTDILQPAYVSVFGPLNAHGQNFVQQYIEKPGNVNKSVTKTSFCPIFKEIIENPQTSRKIINGFKNCGIYPFNPNAVDFTKCVQSTMENVQVHDNTSITNEDLISTRKVLKYLRPTLKAKKVNVKLILQEVNKLRNINQESRILYKTKSEDRSDSIKTERTSYNSSAPATSCLNAQEERSVSLTEEINSE